MTATIGELYVIDMFDGLPNVLISKVSIEDSLWNYSFKDLSNGQITEIVGVAELPTGIEQY
jgi:hypothetical protein